MAYSETKFVDNIAVHTLDPRTETRPSRVSRALAAANLAFAMALVRSLALAEPALLSAETAAVPAIFTASAVSPCTSRPTNVASE